MLTLLDNAPLSPSLTYSELLCLVSDVKFYAWLPTQSVLFRDFVSFSHCERVRLLTRFVRERVVYDLIR